MQARPGDFLTQKCVTWVGNLTPIFQNCLISWGNPATPLLIGAWQYTHPLSPLLNTESPGTSSATLYFLRYSQIFFCMQVQQNRIKWASPWDYGTYHIGDQRRLRRACASVWPEPLLFAHMKYGSRRRVWPNIRHLDPLCGCACAFEEWVYGGRKVSKSHEMAQIFL